MTRIRSGLAGALVLACIATSAPAGFAADAAKASAAREAESHRSVSNSQRRAEARYEQGVAAYREGRYKDAIDAFLEADSLAPSAALSYNAALAYERLLDNAGALRFYRDFLRRSPETPDSVRVRKRVSELEQRLASRGVQQVTFLSEPAGATISVDGKALGVTPWTTELTPGHHRASLSLKGYDEESREFELPHEHAIDVGVAFRASVAQATARTSEPVEKSSLPAPEHRANGLMPWPWIALGVGGAALVSAGAFELSRRAAERDAEKETTQLGYSEKLDAADSRQRSARWLGAAGGALLVTSGVLFVLDSSGRKEAPQASLSVDAGRCFLSYRSAF